ncbi:glycosyltransferase family 39 protein [uncultured Mucilaginibacter sp.]|uniref:glycosyltransferase family 39 protein n=1 Tax=uncultured Mucilaginibacter sp. TaxID=797541 RepID=UPI00261AD0C4|nr:glycosyltransferase family 39 protein [uncultured Mucilaginibacter sp.]
MKKLLRWYSGLNIYLQLAPFLLLYLAICVVLAPHNFVDDEERYIRFARNILHGFYSPPLPNIDLWNGPGYPLVVAPFLLLKLPLMIIRILNALMMYASLVLVYKTIRLYASQKTALVCAILLGLYFPVYEKIPLVLTECLTWFLISLIGYLFFKIGKEKKLSSKTIWLCAIAIAFLTMTKVVFGYVIIAMLFISLILFLLPKFRSSAKKFTYVFALSFLLCVPYLVYTYSVTHKPFYWTNSGGWSLYNMSAPYPNDWGDWKDNPQMLQNPNYKVFVDSVLKLPPLERDAIYKTKAIENIKHYPKKYMLNCVANLGRMFFSYPFTNMEQDVKTYFTIIPNMFVLVFMVITLGLGIFHYKKLPQEIILLLLFILIYLAGSTLVSAFRRMFYITMPFWTVFIAYVLTNIVSIKFKHNRD